MDEIHVPNSYPSLPASSPISDEVVVLFALDHRGPRGATQGETKQQADYASKVNAIRNDYRTRYGEELTIADLHCVHMALMSKKVLRYIVFIVLK